MLQLAICAQIVIAVSIAFVWILRLENIDREFQEYHLPDVVRNLVGATKIATATLLVAGIWYPALVFYPALLMALLMAAAQLFHLRARHPLVKFLPSLVLLALSLFVAAVYRKAGVL